MRLISLLVAAILMGGPVSARQNEPSTPAKESSPSEDFAPHALPVSLDKIREALSAAPTERLKWRDEKPHFQVLIQERQKIDALLATLKFNSGPPVSGGLYGYDQQQRLFPKVDNPLVQPYAAFSQGELLQVLFTTFLEKYFAGRLISALTSAERAHAEEEARQEVARALAEFWAAQARAR